MFLDLLQIIICTMPGMLMFYDIVFVSLHKVPFKIILIILLYQNELFKIIINN